MGIRVPVSLRGIIIATEWTPLGDVAAVEIAAYDEKRYRVVGNRFGEPLLAHTKKMVTVDGFLDTENDNQLLYVERFCIENPDESNPSQPGNTAKTF